MAANSHSTPTSTATVALELYSNQNWPKLLLIDSPNVANPSVRWRLGSRFLVPTVGLFSKFWMTMMNNSTVHNAAVLYEALNSNYLASRSTRAWFNVSSSSRGVDRRPLITYSNHASCLDDPLMWGALLPLRWQFNSDRHRWSSAAAEVCFSKKWHSMFFSLGKTFPIIRGEGIYQPAMDYASKLMQAGQWLHFFPEGKVIPKPENSDPTLLQFRFDENGRPVALKKIKEAGEGGSSKTKEESLSFTESFFTSKLSTTTKDLVANYSLKWGIARLIIEHVLGEGSHDDTEYDQYHSKSSSPSSGPLFQEPTTVDKRDSVGVLPEVDLLPIYHLGMDDVLPTIKPYVPRMFQKVTFLVRPEGPIRIDKAFLMRLFGEEDQPNSSTNSSTTSSLQLSLTEKRIRLMQFLEDELNNLKDKATWLHEQFNQPSSTTIMEE